MRFRRNITMKMNRDDYKELMREFSPTTLSMIRSICAGLIKDELERSLEVDTRVLSALEIRIGSDKILEAVLQRAEKGSRKGVKYLFRYHIPLYLYASDGLVTRKPF